MTTSNIFQKQIKSCSKSKSNGISSHANWSRKQQGGLNLPLGFLIRLLNIINPFFSRSIERLATSLFRLLRLFFFLFPKLLHWMNWGSISNDDGHKRLNFQTLNLPFRFLLWLLGSFWFFRCLRFFWFTRPSLLLAHGFLIIKVFLIRILKHNNVQNPLFQFSDT